MVALRALDRNARKTQSFAFITALFRDRRSPPRISVITTKRAYAELEAQGFIETVQGKGSFVAGGNTEFLREERLRHIEELLGRAVQEAQGIGLGLDEVKDMFDAVSQPE